MPGAYAHITLVNFAKEPERLEEAGIPIPAIKAVLEYFGFCELGAVSPDYPYLHFAHSDSKRWADVMHYERTGEPIKKGIEFVKDMSGTEQAKALAWLLGYAAHVVADVTIHPVVECRVGPYAANAKAHRICELNQDAYIFQRLNLSEIGLSEHLDSGIWGCCDTPNSGVLAPTIVRIWEKMLAFCHPAEYAANEPDISAWHAGFKVAVDAAEEGNRLPLFARHLAVNSGLTYPAVTDIDASYIIGIATPEGEMDYDMVFDRALKNVVSMWAMIGK
jgi:hypothetical protein